MGIVRINRRASVLLLVALALLAGAGVGLGQGPEAAPPVAPAAGVSLKAAFEQLADADASVRESAQDRIVQMGPAVVEPLKKLIETASDVEQRTGAQAALARIVEQASTGATMITMKMNQATPAEIVAELGKQAKTDFKNFGGRNAAGQKHSITIDNQPFWAAVQEIGKVTGWRLQNRGNNTIGFGPGGQEYSGPTHIDGPFMIVAQSIHMSSNIQLGNKNNNANRNMSLNFMCFIEPKLQVSQRPYNVRLTEATDDTGKSLVFGSPMHHDNFTNDANPMWSASAPLAVPEPGAKKIASLKGQMKLMVATKIETIEIPDLLTAKNITKSAGGNSLTVKDCTVNGEQVTMNVSITFTNRRMGHQLIQQLKLLDANGNTFQNPSTNGGGGMNRLDYKLTYNRSAFDDDGEKKLGTPAKVVWAVPTETKPLDFNFEFKDLPLP